MRKDFSLAISFLAGAIVATGITLLYTTDKGKDIRRNIVKWLNEKGIQLNKEELEELLDAIFSNDSKKKTENTTEESPIK